MRQIIHKKTSNLFASICVIRGQKVLRRSLDSVALCAIGLVYFVLTHSAFAIAGVDTAPSPSAPHEITFVQPQEARLENGLRVIVAERADLPLLAAEIVIRTGGEVDPDGRAGAANMVGDLLTKGTDKMSAPEIANAIESLGGEIESGSHWDFSSATVIVMSNKAEPALSILADVIMHPVFKQEEIDRLKRQVLDLLRVNLQQPNVVGRYVADRIVYGGGGYGHPVNGTMETVEAIQRDDLVKLYQVYYKPENATLVLAGDITLDQGKKYAQQFFGDWKAAPPSSEETAPPKSGEWKPENVVIDMPEAGQASVTVAKPSVQRDSPDYYTGLVANAALGTGFVSRLNREIRIKRGLSYGASSAIDARRSGGAFIATAQTKNPSAGEVAGLLQSELKRLGTNPVQDEELKSRQAVITGGFARHLETNQGLVAQLAALVTYNRPLDAVNTFIGKINAVTSADVSSFAAKYFESAPSLVIVGKASEFLEALKKDFPDVKVIPQKDLDLNRAELKRN